MNDRQSATRSEYASLDRSLVRAQNSDRPSSKQIRYAISCAHDLGVFAGSDQWNRAVSRLVGRNDRLLPYQLSRRELSRVIDAIKAKLDIDQQKIERLSVEEISQLDDPWWVR